MGFQRAQRHSLRGGSKWAIERLLTWMNLQGVKWREVTMMTMLAAWGHFGDAIDDRSIDCIDLLCPPKTRRSQNMHFKMLQTIRKMPRQRCGVHERYPFHFFSTCCMTLHHIHSYSTFGLQQLSYCLFEAAMRGGAAIHSLD